MQYMPVLSSNTAFGFVPCKTLGTLHVFSMLRSNLHIKFHKFWLEYFSSCLELNYL